MRIAYFILLHHKFSQFCWLFDAIYTADDVFLIHIDHKSSTEFHDQVRSYIGRRPNVSFLPCNAITYSSWSLVKVELQAMRILLNSARKWQYLINLSGQDYPIKPLEFIKTSLQAEWPRNFIRVWPFAKVRELEPNDPHLKRLLVFNVFGRRLVRTRIRLPFPTSVNIQYKGSAWHMLTRDFCQWLLTDPMAKRIERLVKFTSNPDEIFFQALIMNSPYRDLRTKDYGREIIWPGPYSPHPQTLRMEQYHRLSATPALFARKFDDSVDRELLVHLARDHGHRVPQA